MSTALTREVSAPRRRRGATLAKKQARWGWLFAAPATVHIFVWTGIPVLLAIGLSFTRYDMLRSPRFIGLDNYRFIFQDEIFWKAMLNNLIIGVVGIPISMFIALVLAVMLNQGLRGQGLFRTLIFLPQVTATVAIAMMWLWLYSPNSTGLANRFLALFGISPQPFLVSSDQALGSVILITIWAGLGLRMMIYLAALQGIDKQLYEAASIDGASTIQKFFHITVPQLRPATFFLLVMSIIWNFQAFDLIYVLTQGGPARATNVVTYEIYSRAFQQYRMGLATAQSVVLLVVLVVLTVLSRKLTGKDND